MTYWRIVRRVHFGSLIAFTYWQVTTCWLKKAAILSVTLMYRLWKKPLFFNNEWIHPRVILTQKYTLHQIPSEVNELFGLNHVCTECIHFQWLLFLRIRFQWIPSICIQIQYICLVFITFYNKVYVTSNGLRKSFLMGWVAKYCGFSIEDYGIWRKL